MPTYSQISFKTSHNSYDRRESTVEQLTFHADAPSKCGCMGLEFDIWRHTSPYTPGGEISDKFFTVAHTIPGNVTLEHYLQRVTEWHKINPRHPPVLIYLDIKSSHDGYQDFHLQIDSYLQRYFNANLIYKPSNFDGPVGTDLCQRVIASGWKDVDAMAGKFIFCLSGNASWKAEYATHDLLTERLCFSDVDFSDSEDGVKPPTSGNFVFFNFHIFHAHRKVWMKTIPPFTESNFITRAYEVDSSSNWGDCLSAKVSALATNKISNHDWAQVSTFSAYVSK